MKRWIIAGLAAASITPLAQALPAAAYDNSRTWAGHGTYEVESTFLDNEICGVVNGAPIDGPYVLWVLTASRATNADISIDGGATQTMTRSGNGSFHYLQDMETWTAPTSATATFDGPNTKRVNLTLGQGCTQASE